ncbi:muscle M-line assembly protein unc-89-like isoform X2 [Maniola jurtina]|uniref:muscle M-line assembly protein unc-89-like isoform X2 n=1 Tax=Maniola jurtina TaxID=191418 RepID=UPI001E68F92F|nr:muscle M-line assembly protein unc-89-like isoform X2 [Maniola jurtina]
MSQIVTRKGPVGEEKDKRQTDSPVKEMKKKIAANAEKEKQAAEKPTEKPAHSEKRPEKASEKIDKDKPADKTDKKDKVDKTPDKREKLDKSVDKKDSKLDKSIDKKDKLDKSIEKKDKTERSGDKKEAEKKENAVEKESTSEKKEGDDKKEDKSSKEKDGKVETDEKAKKPEPKAKENGAKVNGEQNGDTVSSEDELQDLDEKDEMFPELAYEDSDGEYFEPPTPEGVPSRSYTRRSQSKLLKLKEDVPSSDRKLRSADSPKPHDRKERAGSNSSDATNKVLIPVVVLEEANIHENEEKKAEEMEVETNSAQEKAEREIEVVVEVENEDEGRVKADTNYSKSRVKVSPYRRSARLADNTNTSLLANYTGNNTTMEMDITAETSSFISEEPESPYLSGLRSIRGRRSYKPLREMALRNIGVYSSTRSNTSTTTVSEHPTRPTGTVVGRKRKPSHEETIELATEVEEAARSKRARLLERLAKPFRMVSTPLPARRAAEIVGINTDLPLSAPVASTETFDPEAIKPPTVTPVDPPTPVTRINERDSKRCVVM